MSESSRPLVTCYKNRTLQGNWFEDRLVSTAGLDGTASKHQQTSTRVMAAAVFVDQQSSLYKTTKQTFDAVVTGPRVAVRQPASMVVPSNMEDSLQSHGRHDQTTQPGHTGSMAAAAQAQAALQFTTTYGRCFHTERQAAKASSDPSYFAVDRSHAMKGSLRKDTYSAEHEAATSGRGGARGLFTRSAAEAGSLYGVSVFADEYAARPRGQQSQPMGTAT